MNLQEFSKQYIKDRILPIKELMPSYAKSVQEVTKFLPFQSIFTVSVDQIFAISYTMPLSDGNVGALEKLDSAPAGWRSKDNLRDILDLTWKKDVRFSSGAAEIVAKVSAQRMPLEFLIFLRRFQTDSVDIIPSEYDDGMALQQFVNHYRLAVINQGYMDFPEREIVATYKRISPIIKKTVQSIVMRYKVIR